MRTIVIFSIIAIAGVGSYFLLQEKEIVAKFPNFLPQRWVSWLQRSDDFVASSTTPLVEAGKDLASSTVQRIKEKTFDIFKDKVDEQITAIGKNIGVVNVNNQSVIQSSVSLAVPVRVLTRFSLINNFAKGEATYEIDWKDGAQEQGTFSAGQSKILSHQWQQAGQYPIQFIVKQSKEHQEYTFVVSVFDE